jgi:hypothetical protein
MLLQRCTTIVVRVMRISPIGVQRYLCSGLWWPCSAPLGPLTPRLDGITKVYSVRDPRQSSLLSYKYTCLYSYRAPAQGPRISHDGCAVVSVAQHTTMHHIVPTPLSGRELRNTRSSDHPIT